ncbi:Putative transcription initiation factor Rrn11 [Septoria linicola]|uniref:Transcription initiation factor Rrn11 n=1 Tax=Septoria linicola TaxID=215465 RepID=A0A9Q9B1S3_9PEZI|nr:Putative transcription initiation factor Rrn11 [Septoria linicola]
MASYAPVYRLPTSQRSFLASEQKRERKRKRGEDADGDESDGENGEQKIEDEALSAIKLEALEEEPRVLHPVNKKDPYYIAGWPREKPLPGGNFPHAAIHEAVLEKPTVEEELAKLKPPIYVPRKRPDDKTGSLRGRHLDNLTAILHKCMLNQDWARAARVWGLILRTEVGGFGPDIRQHGRWVIGAELLMRRQQTIEKPVANDESESGQLDTQALPHGVPVIPDDGFQLAREYYERMCLQYPHLARSHHSAVNAYAIYPALFNIWTYQVQDLSKRARQKLAVLHESPEFDDVHSVQSDTSEHRRILRQIRSKELSEAILITRRLDELLLSPPYDTNPELLELRGMISLWLANLHKVLGEMQDTVEGDDEGDVDSSLSKIRHRKQADIERANARDTFSRVINKGSELSAENLAFLEGDNSLLADADDD